jgi:hypothetical protein
VRIKGGRKAGEHVGSQGGDDVFRRALAGEKDALYAWTNVAHLVEQSQIFFDGAVGAGDDDAEGSHAQALQSVGATRGIIVGDTGVRECIADTLADLGITSDDQDAAHV